MTTSAKALDKPGKTVYHQIRDQNQDSNPNTKINKTQAISRKDA